MADSVFHYRHSTLCGEITLLLSASSVSSSPPMANRRPVSLAAKDLTGASQAPSARDRILKTAKQLFAKQGYDHTSTVAIARAAGTSESQVMKHFGSKEGLLEEIFNAGWEE